MFIRINHLSEMVMFYYKLFHGAVKNPGFVAFNANINLKNDKRFVRKRVWRCYGTLPAFAWREIHEQH
jgi:hypothetical protein